MDNLRTVKRKKKQRWLMCKVSAIAQGRSECSKCCVFFFYFLGMGEFLSFFSCTSFFFGGSWRKNGFIVHRGKKAQQKIHSNRRQRKKKHWWMKQSNHRRLFFLLLSLFAFPWQPKHENNKRCRLRRSTSFWDSFGPTWLVDFKFQLSKIEFHEKRILPFLKFAAFSGCLLCIGDIPFHLRNI